MHLSPPPRFSKKQQSMATACAHTQTHGHPLITLARVAGLFGTKLRKR